MEIEEFFTGEHPDGTKFRVRRINELWYYSVQVMDYYGFWYWRTEYRSPSKLDVVNKVIEDKRKREERVFGKWEE